MKYLEKVVKIGSGSGSRTERRRRIKLADEALKDLIPFYAELDDYKSARNYFSNLVSSDRLGKIMEKLAYYYNDSGNRTKARFHFRDLINRSPRSPKSFDYQYQIVNMFSSAGNDKIFKSELYTWIEKYGPEGRWAKYNRGENPGVVKKASQLMEATLRTFILQNHQTAQNTRGQLSQNNARTGYELYFSTFKNTKNLADMHFYFGELLFDMKNYKKAARNYLWVVSKAPTSQFYEKSILNSILALEKNLPTDKQIANVVGSSKEAVPLDKTTLLFENVAQKYF